MSQLVVRAVAGLAAGRRSGRVVWSFFIVLPGVVQNTAVYLELYLPIRKNRRIANKYRPLMSQAYGSQPLYNRRPMSIRRELRHRLTVPHRVDFLDSSLFQ